MRGGRGSHDRGLRGSPGRGKNAFLLNLLLWEQGPGVVEVNNVDSEEFLAEAGFLILIHLMWTWIRI